MEPLTFMSVHLIVMFIEALLGHILLHKTAGRPDAAGLTLSHLAAIWQLGYVLSEPLLLVAQLFLSTTSVAGILAGGALASIGCAAVALTYTAARSLRNPAGALSATLPRRLWVSIVAAALLSMGTGLVKGDPTVAQGVGIAFYMLGRLPLALLWIGVAVGAPCCCESQRVPVFFNQAPNNSF